ncbi:tripartite tricarboxylate transporter permease [Candidatus Pacearchaeota archaeon]|nr:tripartite tricarboxylate transporter permease [Candidatus Pacearchaeota archaeon]
MLIEILLFLILGIIAGTLTGLIPGIHINLIGIFIVSLSTSLFSSITPIYLVVFIASMAIAHTFIDFIPSIFLGCPDTDTELSVLPGHELLKKGQGYEAIILTCYGSLAAIFILILISSPFFIFKESIIYLYNFIPVLIPGLLILTSFFLISLENKKFSAIFVFLLTGFLGILILNPHEILGKALELKQPLLPLLTGLFGGSMLVTSIKNKTQIPKQKIKKPSVNILKPIIGALIASPLCSFLPGLGSGQAAIIGNTISRTDKKGFLILLGATNTLVMGFSFITLYIISKTRTGAAVAIQKIIGELNPKILFLILVVVLISGVISFFITISLAKFFSQKITKINYTITSTITLIFLGIIVFLVSSFLGLIVLIISTFAGIYCISLKVKRTNMMGCLLIPTIVLYLF